VCELSAKASLRYGLFLCERHCRQIEAHVRLILLQGIVSVLDLCLKSLELRRDEKLIQLLRFQQAGKVQELEEARRDLRLAENGFHTK
jgi:hypothetical protein